MSNPYSILMILHLGVTIRSQTGRQGIWRCQRRVRSVITDLSAGPMQMAVEVYEDSPTPEE
jgi:hypothetical protein